MMLLLCVLAATVLTVSVNSFLSPHTSGGGVRIVFTSSAILRFSNNAALFDLYTFNDLISVRSALVKANFFERFCEAQDLLTPYDRSRVLLSTRKLLLDGDGKKFRVHDGNGGHLDEDGYIFSDIPSPSSISFRISAWGAKRFMPCGVLLINFPSEESYNNFFHNKSAFYEDLCNLESKCFPVGTYLPLTSSATFDLEWTRYNRQAMIIHEKIMIEGIVSEIIDAGNLLIFTLPSLTNIDPASVCKYAKQSLCNYGGSVVFRYLPSLPSGIDNDYFLHPCSMMFNNDLIDFKVALPWYNKIDAHPEIIVIEPLTDFEDHLVSSISEVMRDLRVIYTIIVKYQFPIIISLIVFFITCCLKKYFFFLAYTVLTYSFNYCLFFLILLFVVLIVNIIRELELIKLHVVYECGCFLISIVIYHYLQLEVIPALTLPHKVNKPMQT